MGSFSEVVISFSLRPDVDSDVLRAFSGLPLGESTHGGGDRDPAPELPPPHEEPIDDYTFYEACESSGYHAYQGGELPEDFKPWMYDWTWVLSGGYWAASFKAETGGSIAWTGSGWHITSRLTAKEVPKTLTYWFGWMGEFAIESNEQHPSLIGYIKYEYENRPWLIWHAGSGSFVFENLNGPWDDSMPMVLALTTRTPDSDSNPRGRWDLEDLVGRRIHWTCDPTKMPMLVADLDGEQIAMRLNIEYLDLPAYTLHLGDGEFVDLRKLPEGWSRPRELQWPGGAQRIPPHLGG